MQAQILYKLKLVPISRRNLICRHKPYTSQNSCTYPMGIEHASAIEKVEVAIKPRSP